MTMESNVETCVYNISALIYKVNVIQSMMTELIERIDLIEPKIMAFADHNDENEPENVDNGPDFKALEADNERLRSVVSGLLDQLEAKEVDLMDAMDEIDHLKAELKDAKFDRAASELLVRDLLNNYDWVKRNENPKKFFPTHGGAEDAD